MTDPLRQLSDEGVAIWLDDMSRERLVSGSLKALVRDKHVVGVTTNPTIFQNAIAGSHVYDEQLRGLAALDIPVAEAVRLVTTHDVRASATCSASSKSLEVAPGQPRSVARCFLSSSSVGSVVSVVRSGPSRSPAVCR
jgi:transaldolase